MVLNKEKNLDKNFTRKNQIEKKEEEKRMKRVTSKK